MTDLVKREDVLGEILKRQNLILSNKGCAKTAESYDYYSGAFNGLLTLASAIRALPAALPIGEVERLRDALDELLDACEAINIGQGRQVIDPHAMTAAYTARATTKDTEG